MICCSLILLVKKAQPKGNGQPGEDGAVGMERFVPWSFDSAQCLHAQ
jgi:hypothetical protein